MTAGPITLRTHGPAQTEAVAAAVHGLIRPGDVVLLIGDLGAGKTAFARGFARAAGVEGPVTSPTFTLVHQYRAAQGVLLHVDAYRLDGPGGYDDLGLDEALDDGAVALVEWGDVVAAAVGPEHLDVRIAWVGDGEDDARELTFDPVGPGWAARGAALAAAVTSVAGAGRGARS